MTPQEAAEHMMTLSEEQSRLSDEWITLEIKKIEWFTFHRPEFKSDKACERAFHTKEDGINHIKKEARLKAIAKELSVIKTFLRHEENKARNLY